MTETDDEIQTGVAYAFWEVDCDACGDSTRIDHDPSGETVECEGCGSEIYVEGVR